MRRVASAAALLVVLLLLTVAVAPGVSAQDTSEHPAVGAWIIDATPEDTTDAPQLVSIAPGGIATNVSVEGTGVGSWAATGDRTADVTIVVPFSNPECGCAAGVATIRASIEVAEDGQSFMGTFTFEPPADIAEAMGIPAGQRGPGDVTGQRIAVEAMGEPVGPLLEVPEPGESAPTSEASPMAPQESPAA